MQTLLTTALDYNNKPEYYPFLEEEIKYQAIQLINKSKLLKGLLADSINYSLSYSIGDGVSFREGDYRKTLTYGKTTKDVTFYIAKNDYANLYSHEKTFYVNYHSGYNLTKKEDEKIEKLSDQYTEELRDICKKLEKFGYQYIESENEQSMLEQAFEDFKEINNIQSDTNLFDYPYETEPTHDYTHIATEGDTSIKGLWAKLPPLVSQTTQVSYNTFESAFTTHNLPF